MNFEAIHPNESETSSHRGIDGRAIPPERIGGPLKPNHFVTTELGVKEASPLLDQLKVVYKVSLLTREMLLDGQGAVAPAEYRIEIMDRVSQSEPAAPAYVGFVYEALKRAQIPIERLAPNDREIRGG